MSGPRGDATPGEDAPLVLVVEDDAALRSGLAALLRREGLRAAEARDGCEALDRLSERKVHTDLVILDLMLPDLDGLEVLRALRRGRPEVPVLVLSAKGSVLDKVTLLDAGADDYLVKPFQPAELLARIRALLKRFRKTEPTHLRFGPIDVDLAGRRVLRDGAPVALSATELAILEALARRPGSVVTREEILERVWGLDPPETTRAVDYHILQLRRKLEDDPEHPRLILTERGVGYRLAAGDP